MKVEIYACQELKTILAEEDLFFNISLGAPKSPTNIRLFNFRSKQPVWLYNDDIWDLLRNKMARDAENRQSQQ